MYDGLYGSLRDYMDACAAQLYEQSRNRTVQLYSHACDMVYGCTV